LAGVALLVYMQVVLVGGFDPPIALMFGVPALLFALLVLGVRRRWAPLLGALYWALFLAANAPYLAHDLTHPEFQASFAFSVVLLVPAVVGLAAGFGAARQNYGAPTAASPHTPRWFFTGLAVVAGLGLGAILVGALPRTSASVDPATLATLPALTTAQHQFGQTELRATAGEAVALRLENHDPAGHSFDVDELGVHVSMPPGEPTLALFTPATPGTYAFYCAIPGHREAGMVGTLVVEP
jgi:plastocyanin